MKTDSTDGRENVPDPMKIIHKEQDVITAFCINQVTSHFITHADGDGFFMIKYSPSFMLLKMKVTMNLIILLSLFILVTF